MNKNNLFICICFSFLLNQDIYTGYIIEDNDTLDVFSYQIPSNYSNQQNHPLLVAFHQWGGSQDSPYYTNFDEEAELRNWIFLSPFGGSSNNYNHQEAQNYVEKAIIYLTDNFLIDKNRIYMVGGSMGGASGAIFANNHLNPKKPMVAATASASGILDCERRYYEMDGNNSMIEWFGGTPEEVPFEYHRNSAVYFADTTQSMHYNLQYTPLYLDFGATEPHRYHAEDLYNLLLNYNQNMWIDIEPTGSHGYSVIDEEHACNWLSQYELIDDPDIINVNLDEPSRAYWIEAYNQIDTNNFIRVNAKREYCNDQFMFEGYCIDFENYYNSDSLIFHILNDKYEISDNTISILLGTPTNFSIGNFPSNIGFSGDLFSGDNILDIDADGIPGIGQECFLDNYNIDGNNVIWLRGTDIWGGDCPLYGRNIITFQFSISDINLDETWDLLDIIILMEYIINQEFPDNTQVWNGDINQDQILDILDVILIVNMVLEN